MHSAFSHLKFMAPYMMRHKYSYLLGIAFVFLTNWFMVNIPLYIGASIDLLTDYQVENHEVLVNNIMIVILFATCTIFARTLSRILFFNPGRKIEQEIKNDSLHKLSGLQKGFYEQQGTGTLISIMNNDINSVRAMVGFGALQFFNIFFALSLTPYKMWQISPELTLYCIIPVLVTFVFAYFTISYTRKIMRQRMLDLQDLSSNTVNLLSGVDVLKSHHIQKWAIDEFQKDNQTLFKRSMQLLKVRSFFMPVLYYTDRIVKVLILGVGGLFLMQQDLSLGDVTAMLSYAGLLAMPFILLGMIIAVFQMGFVGISSIRRILDEPDNAIDQNPLEVNKREELFKQGIEIKNLSYDFDEVSALKNISLSITPGQKVGVLGPVGSGKSTLVNCLNRYLDVQTNSIYLDGQDITQMARSDLRSVVRTITQEPFLFSDTVEENIKFGSHEKPDTLSMEEALYQSDMKDEVAKFPQQEHTMVGEKGILLSGGQKQRLSLSRGLFTPCKLIVLDNVLSAVDNETERFLLDQIFEKMRSQSVLIISHRAAVLEKVDKTIVLVDGEIIAEGNHEELMNSCDFYRETWELQQKESEEVAS